MLLLSAPPQGRQPQWSPQISFRLQWRGSAGFAPASLITGSACDTLTFASHRIVAVYTTAPPQVCQYKLDVGQGMPGAIFPWLSEAGGPFRSSCCFSLTNRVIVLSSRYPEAYAMLWLPGAAQAQRYPPGGWYTRTRDGSTRRDDDQVRSKRGLGGGCRVDP